MNSLDILNSIRSVAGNEYQERIPQATRDNISSVGNTLVGSNANTPHFNAFFTNLIQRIGKVIVESMEGVDDLFSVFGNESLDMGALVQKLFVEIPTAHAFDGTATTSMLAQERGTIHVEYTMIDRKLYYKRTLTIEEIKEAFTSVSALDELIRAIIESMLTALTYDKYVMTCEVLKRQCEYTLKGHLANKHVGAIVVPEAVAKYNKTTKEIEWASATAQKEFLKVLRIASRGLKFPHTLDYCKDNDWGADTKTIVKQRTPISKQIMGLEVSTNANIDVDALAMLFNVAKADIETKVVELEDNCLGLSTDEEYYYGGFVCNKDAVERITSLQDSDSFKNPESKAVNYWLHFWGAMAVSRFKDFLAISFKAYTPQA